MPTNRILNLRKRDHTKEDLFAAGEKHDTNPKKSASWLGFKRACVGAGDIKSLEIGIRVINAQLARTESPRAIDRLTTRRKGYENAIKALSPKPTKVEKAEKVERPKNRRPVQKADSVPNVPASNEDMMSMLAAQMQALQVMMAQLQK
jgi:hypothetical protein